MDAYSFPLAWRWTKSEHAILPANVMARIVPIVARHIELPDERRFGPPECIDANCMAPERVRCSLADLRIAPESLVIVLWDHDLAIQTEWSIFCTCWDSFCYPSSDDVEIWPCHPITWLLRYRHWEEFEFRRAA